MQTQAPQRITGYSNQYYSQYPYNSTQYGGVQTGSGGFSAIGGNQQSAYVLVALLSLIVRLVQQLQSVQTLPAVQDQQLTLEQGVKDKITQALNLGVGQTFVVLDKDKDGKLSVGDVIRVTGGALGAISRDITLTAEHIAALTAAPAEVTYLDLPTDLQNAIKQRYTLADGQQFAIADSDKNGQLNSGDVLRVVVGSQIQDFILNDTEIAAIQNLLPVQAQFLNVNQQTQLLIQQRFNIAQGQSFAVVDQDGSGTLSAGDILRVAVNGQLQNTVLSAEDITALTPAPVSQAQFLSLDQGLQLLIQQRFNLAQGQEFAVVDQDNNGALSTGDILKVVVNGQIQDLTLSAEDITALTPAPVSQAQFLSLNQQVQLLIQQRFNLAQGQEFAVVDQDNNNTLSAGDILKVVVNGQIQDLTLSAEDVTALNSTPEQFNYLNLNEATQLIVKQLFNINNSQAFAIADKDGSNTVSAGDILRVAVGNNVQDTVLTAEQATAINNNTQQPAFITLSAAQQTAIQTQFNIQSGQGFGVIDSDGNQGISEGDVLRVIVNGQAQDTVLTAINIAQLSTETSADKTLLLNNYQKWSAANDKNYSFVLTRTGQEPVRITVTNGAITDAGFVSAAATGAVPDANKVTLEDLFNLVAQASNANIVDLSVGYDAAKGFPFSIFFDPNTATTGDEVFLGVSEYTVIGGPS